MKKMYLVLLIVVLSLGCNYIPKTSDNFTWDFSENKSYNYSYIMETYIVALDSNNIDTVFISDMQESGQISIKANKDNAPKLTMNKTQITQIIIDDESTDTLNSSYPKSEMKDLDIYGDLDDKDIHFLHKLIFPLPSPNIKEGESEKTETTNIGYTGESRKKERKEFYELTFIGYEEYHGVNCAILEAEVNISESVETADNSSLAETKGRCKYYFDVENHTYIATDITFVKEVEYDPDYNYSNTTTTYHYDIKYTEE